MSILSLMIRLDAKQCWTKVRECHPDRHTEAELGEQERMEAKMKEVQKAWEVQKLIILWVPFKVTSAYAVLSDQQSRAEYDKTRRIGIWVGASEAHTSPTQSFKDEANFDYKSIFRFLFGGIQAIIFQQSK